MTRVRALSNCLICAAIFFAALTGCAGCRTEKKKVESPPPKQPTTASILTGDIQYHRQFYSTILDNERTLVVWLPPGYEADKTTRYPVLYMHDGQNLFDDATSDGLGEWHADEIATRLIEQNKIVPIIIVGIAHIQSNRVDEYTPTRKRVHDYDTSRHYTTTQPDAMEGGSGDAYAQFVIDEVKPFIDKTYRTQPDRAHTAIGGSSLGGLISLYMAYKYTDVFGMCVAVSPSLWWDQDRMLREIEYDNTWLKRERVWIDMGTDEDSIVTPKQNLQNTRMLRVFMLRAGQTEGQDFVYREYVGGQHNERAWSKRFDQILLFLFGK